MYQLTLTTEQRDSAINECKLQGYMYSAAGTNLTMFSYTEWYSVRELLTHKENDHGNQRREKVAS